jgi:hypothetical protein
MEEINGSEFQQPRNIGSSNAPETTKKCLVLRSFDYNYQKYEFNESAEFMHISALEKAFSWPELMQ